MGFPSAWGVHPVLSHYLHDRLAACLRLRPVRKSAMIDPQLARGWRAVRTSGDMGNQFHYFR